MKVTMLSLAAIGSASAAFGQFSDDFNRSDGPIGGAWAPHAGNFAAFIIESSRGGKNVAGGLDAIRHGVASAHYAEVVQQIDVFNNGTATQYTALMSGLGGAANLFIKVQNNGGPQGFNTMGFYSGNNGTGGWPGAQPTFITLDAPFEAARMKVYFTNAGDTINVEYDTDFNGTPDQSYSRNGVAAFATGFGMGFGIGAFGTSRFDDWLIGTAGALTPWEKSLHAGLQSVVMNASKIVQSFGPQNATLDYTSHYTPTNWEFTLTGTYGGTSVDVTSRGTFNPVTETGEFTSQGTIGAGTWQGSGEWSWQANSLTEISMNWESLAVITVPGFPILRPDKHVTVPLVLRRTQRPVGGGEIESHIFGKGKYRDSINGVPFGREKNEDYDAVLIKRTESGICSVSLPEETAAVLLNGVVAPGASHGTVAIGGRCYPDCDTSTGVGVLDIFDFLCFQNRYSANEPYACNCDTTTGQNVCDIFDFLCFQNAYDAGC